MAGDARRVAPDARGIPGLTARAGAVAGEQGKQHVDLHRKVGLRRDLMALLPSPTDAAEPMTAYVPFIGDGDIAAELYAGWRVLGADLDPVRVANARQRVSGEVRVADCDSWPFADFDGPLSLGDFDSYAYPYASFRAAWSSAAWSSPCVVLFTDGQRQAVKRGGSFRHPDGTKVAVPGIGERRAVFNAYRSKTVEPWFHDLLAPDWQATKVSGYLRDNMLYWGAVIERTASAAAPAERPADEVSARIQAALVEAAVSGNVAAIAMWYERRDRQGDDRTASLDDLARSVGLDP